MARHIILTRTRQDQGIKLTQTRHINHRICLRDFHEQDIKTEDYNMNLYFAFKATQVEYNNKQEIEAK